MIILKKNQRFQVFQNDVIMTSLYDVILAAFVQAAANRNFQLDKSQFSTWQIATSNLTDRNFQLCKSQLSV
jgi:hypothetical protein